jgi:DegV family protein with EDD domain
VPRKITLLTDSTCDLPQTLIQTNGIHLVPQHIIWDGDLFFDGVDLSADDFYQRLATSENLPETAPPSPEEFAAEFENARATDAADQLVAILISSRLSESFANAQKGARLVDFPVFLQDSQTVSMGLGFAVLAAASARDSGGSVDAMLEAARDTRRRTRMFFTVDTLEFLYRGGRIGGARHLIGTALSLKPILSVEQGQVEAVESVRTRSRAVARMLELAAENSAPGDVRIALMSGGADEEAIALLQPSRRQLRPAEMFECHVSPSLGVHAGPGVLGITVCDG